MSTRGGLTAAVVALALALGACGGASPTSTTTSTKQLEVVSWWTSGSEAAALNTLFSAFHASNPGVHAVNGAVAGGAGSNAIVALAKRLQRDDPPDVWQTFAGKSVQGYASRGVVRSVASIFDLERLRARMSPTILRSLMHDGRPLVHNGLNWRSDEVQTALRSFGAMLDDADPHADELTWDQATKKLASGGCAFESMNDSAFGELVAAGARDGVDFGATPFPGTNGSFLAVVDVFVAATKAKNARNALAFLGDISKPFTQVAFNRAKGSIPVLRDVDVAALRPYQRASSRSFWTSPVLLSIAHGEALSPLFEEGFYDAALSYAKHRDADAFANDLEDTVSEDKVPQR